MPRPKLIDVSSAQALAREYSIDLSRPTIIKYVKEKKLGHQIGGKGGKWVINKDKFRRFIRGENDQSNGSEEAPAVNEVGGSEDIGEDQEQQEEENGAGAGGRAADPSSNSVFTL